MSERQTITYLQKRLKEAGIQPQARFGQNFLIDLNLVELIARTAELGPRDVVLEVGTGMGSLTQLLAAQAGHVVTIEIDRNLAPIAREEFEPLGNVTLLQQDALQSKNVLHPLVIETLRDRVSQLKGGRLKLVSNLPYNVATPILSNLLDIEPWPVRMVATIQRELAERIAAEPRSRDYSALSIWIQSQARVEIVRTMPASVFWPKPKVESAILDIKPQTVLRDRLTDRAKFHELIRGIFTHRRKFLRSALVSAVKEKLTKTDVDQILIKMELGPDARAEQLPVEQMIELYECVQEKIREVESGRAGQES
jgi:16S rRNA (adenine1518-N6/adenine1519-N6)-dimethyltransferase